MNFFKAEESGTEEGDHHEINVPATSGYDIGRKLLSLGLYGIDEEKLDNKSKSDKGLANIGPTPSAAEALAKKKKKKVKLYFVNL